MQLHTSYISKIKKLEEQDILPIAIIQYVPKSLKVLQFKLLAPKPHILAEYKATGDVEAFTQSFKEQLLTIDANKVIRKLQEVADTMNKKAIALVCYEKSGDFCHRHLIAEWLQTSELITDQITELEI